MEKSKFRPPYLGNLLTGFDTLLLLLLLLTGGQSNLTRGCIATAHESFDFFSLETFCLNGFNIKRVAHPICQ